jgi:ferritin-like metal-binding protein YciE
MRNFQDLFVYELQEMYDAEVQIERLLPDCAKKAHTPKLKDAFRHHLDETRHQIDRLRKIANEHNIELQGGVCNAVKVYADEAHALMKTFYPSEVRDAALISVAQCIEHYEIAQYGTLKSFAKYLGWKDVEKLLDETSKEEGHADKLLSDIAVGGFFTTGVNEMAASKSA